MPARAFPAYPGSIPAARDYVVEMLDEQPAALQETAAVLVSELATNAVRHGFGQEFEVSVEHGPGEDRLRVGVTDTGSGTPMVRRPPVTAEHGRGLQLIGLFADRWGVRRRRGDDAKTVWFELTGATISTPPHAPGQRAPEPADSAAPRRSPPAGSPSTPRRPDGRSSAGGRPHRDGSGPGARAARRSAGRDRPDGGPVGRSGTSLTVSLVVGVQADRHCLGPLLGRGEGSA